MYLNTEIAILPTRQLTPEQTLENDLENIISILTVSMLKAANEKAKDLHSGTMNNAVVMMNAQLEKYEKVSHAVHWEIVTDLGYIDFYAGNPKIPGYWKLTAEFPGFDNISIIEISNSIMEKHADYLKCKYTGCKTMSELRDCLSIND